MSMEHGVNTSTVKNSHGTHGTSGHGYGKSQAGAAGGFASLLSGLGADDETLGAGLLGFEATETTAGEGFDPAADIDAAAVVPGFGFDPLRGASTHVPQDEDPARTAAAAAAALAALGLDPLAGAASMKPDTLGGSATTLATPIVSGGAGFNSAQSGANMPVPGDATATVAKSTGARATGAQAGAETQGTARDVLQRELGLPAKSPEVSTLAMDGLGQQRPLGQRNAVVRADAAKADALRGAKGDDAAARLGWRSEISTQVAQANLAAGGSQTGFTGDTASGRFGFGAGERGEEGARLPLNELVAAGAVSSGVSGATSVDSSNSLTPATVYTDPALSAETQVAEQVSYWIGRGARNAEISVEGLAENPIHITIAMQGQEASVAFRAEQAETRQVLEDAMPHLRELLEREGLTLADVSVGHSNTGWNGGSQASAQAREDAASRARVGMRQSQEDPGVPAQGSARVVPLPAGRTLDLFV